MAYQRSKIQFRLIAAGIILAVLCFALAAYRNQGTIDSRPVFLVTGDCDKLGDFCHDVYDGVKEAVSTVRIDASERKPVVQLLNTHGRTSLDSFRDTFLELYIRRDVRAVISADISTIAPIVIRVANSYRIPVLLAVATNNDILKERRADLAFRLVPTDSQQAQLMADWCKCKLRPVIIHGGQTPYGRFLGSTIVDLLDQTAPCSPKRAPIVITGYFDATDLFSALVPIRELGIDGMVFIGYADRFKELYGKLKALNLEIPVLLSDGCYAPSLIQSPPSGDFALSFPIDPKPRANRHNIRASGVFGYDAYVLLVRAFSDMDRNSPSEGSFPASLRNAAKTTTVQEDLLERYKFDINGENESAHFQEYSLNKAATPTKEIRE